MEQKLKGKVALITGSSSGIGKAVAKLFATHGANIIVTSFSKKEEGNQTLKEIKALSNTKHIHINCDLSKRIEVQKTFAKIEKEYGRLDILINNAGIAPSTPFKDIRDNNFDAVFSTNVKSIIWCSQLASKLMKNKGWIVNTGSVRGLDYAGRSINYSASKAAVHSLTKTLALELAPNIFVNAVLPGITDTPLHQNKTPETIKKMVDETLLKRFTSPDEIASAYLFFVIQEYITGSLLVADGGMSLLCR